MKCSDWRIKNKCWWWWWCFFVSFCLGEVDVLVFMVLVLVFASLGLLLSFLVHVRLSALDSRSLVVISLSQLLFFGLFWSLSFLIIIIKIRQYLIAEVFKICLFPVSSCYILCLIYKLVSWVQLDHPIISIGSSGKFEVVECYYKKRNVLPGKVVEHMWTIFRICRMAFQCVHDTNNWL